MNSLFSGAPVGKRLEEGRIWLVWDAAVGSRIAAKARPVSFRDGVLTVAVANSPWLQQLTFLKQGIIAKLNEQLGCELVRDIFLKSGRLEAPPPPPTPRPTPRSKRTLTEEETHRIEDQTASVSDPALRDAFVRILAKDLETKL